MAELLYAAGVALLRFTIGFAMVAAVPTYPILMLVLLFVADPRNGDPDAIGGWGADCSLREKAEAASPDGRFIALSIRTACNDKADLMHDQSEIFVRATRLDRSAHLLTLERSGPKPAALHWQDNQTIVIAMSIGAQQTYSFAWCGIAVEPQADSSR